MEEQEPQLTDEEATQAEADLEERVAGMEARELSKRLTFPPPTAPPSAKSIKHWLKREKAEPYKPLAMDMGMKPTAVYPNLYERDDLPDILFNSQGCMDEEPRCATCNDAGFVRVPLRGKGAWVCAMVGCPSCNGRR